MKVGVERGLEGALSIIIINLQLRFAAVRPEECEISDLVWVLGQFIEQIKVHWPEKVW